MSVYLIARIAIDDRDRYRDYEAGFAAAIGVFNTNGGRLLSVDEDPLVLEGTWDLTRHVVIEFPDRESAMAWYESADYQEAAQHRFASATSDVLIVEGLPTG